MKLFVPQGVFPNKAPTGSIVFVQFSGTVDVASIDTALRQALQLSIFEQGNPLINGVYNFPITTTGCPKTVFVTISNVNTSVGITLTSAVATDNQTLCQSTFSTPIIPIIYNVIGASNVVVSGIPIGVTAVFSVSTGQLIISGTPTQAGVFNYTITSAPCSIVKTGVIRVSTPISVTNEIVTNVSCSNINDGAISVTIVGGVSFNGLYAIHWSGPNGFQQNQTTITLASF